MSYENPRPGKTLIPIRAKVVGKDEYIEYPVGKVCKIQRDPSNGSQFIIYFKYNKSQGIAIIHRFPADQLPETIRYTDSRGNL
jgi:hypothetical protein